MPLDGNAEGRNGGKSPVLLESIGRPKGVVALTHGGAGAVVGYR